MSGEHGREGWANTKLFSDLVAKLGWVLRGPIDQNLPCTKCQPYKNGNLRGHGVDAMFTLKCPYLGRHRAIIVDGKRYSMTSVKSGGGSKKLTDWLRETVTTVAHARESLEILLSERNLPATVHFDTAIVAWDCHEGWDAEKAKEWINEIKISGYMKPHISAFLGAKNYLDKIQTIVQFKDTIHQLEFMYRVKNRYVWSEVLVPEYISSAMTPIRTKKNEDDKWTVGAFYFDEYLHSNITFLVSYLSHMGLMTHDSIEVLIPCRLSDVEIYQSHIDSALNENDFSFGEISKIVCKRIPKSAFDS